MALYFRHDRIYRKFMSSLPRLNIIDLLSRQALMLPQH